MQKNEVLKKIFIIFSIIYILVLIGFYSVRLIHYYKLENKTDESGETINYFSDWLESTLNISDASGGLYINDKEYVYKYAANENYLWYSGNLWRILKINEDKTIDVIINDSISMIDINYGIEAFLSDFYKNLNKEFLVPLTFCNDNVEDLNTLTCDNLNNADIALLDAKTYDQVGGVNSFLNNNSFYWLSNKDENNAHWYVDDQGALGVNTKSALNIRPIIRLKSDIVLKSGGGTFDNPYIIENQEKVNLIDANIGDYVLVNDSLGRILSKSENSISLKAVDCLKENDECLLKEFGENNLYLSSDIFKYLNETYYETIQNKDFLVKDKFYVGPYSSNHEELLTEEAESYIGLPKIGDYYIVGDSNSYLLTPGASGTIYTINEIGNYYLNLTSSTLKIYPIINLDKELKIESGLGTIDSPYILSR